MLGCVITEGTRSTSNALDVSEPFDGVHRRYTVLDRQGSPAGRGSRDDASLIPVGIARIAARTDAWFMKGGSNCEW